MDYLEEKILYMDIGIKFIKVLFIKVNWQKIKTVIYSNKVLFNLDLSCNYISRK